MLSLGSLSIALCFYVYVGSLVQLFSLSLIAEVAFNAKHRSDLLPQTLKRCNLEFISPHTKSGCISNA